MYKKFVGALYALNAVFEAMFTLALPIALGFGISALLVTCLSAPGWIYAVFITLGALSGFYCMIKYVLSAMSAYERLEKEQNGSKNSDKTGNNNG